MGFRDADTDDKGNRMTDMIDYVDHLSFRLVIYIDL